MTSVKVCKVCHVEKSYASFGKHSGTKDKLDSRCKECRHRKYLLNRDEVIARASRHYVNNKTHVLEVRKAWYKVNRVADIEKRRQWAKRNPDKVRKNARLGSRKRRALKRGVMESYKEERITRIVFGNLCFNCNSSDRLEIDHHYPLSIGFPLTTDNAVLLCKSCNTSKGNKMPEVFYTKEQIDRLEWILSKV